MSALEVPQQPFATPPAVVLQRIEQNPDMRLVLIEVDARIVGYFALQTGPGMTRIGARETDVFLRTLAIDRAFRRRGIARRALGTDLEPFLHRHFPQADRVYLLVSQANTAALALYETAGFSSTGQQLQGPWGKQLVKCRQIG